MMKKKERNRPNSRKRSENEIKLHVILSFHDFLPLTFTRHGKIYPADTTRIASMNQEPQSSC